MSQVHKTLRALLSELHHLKAEQLANNKIDCIHRGLHYILAFVKKIKLWRRSGYSPKGRNMAFTVSDFHDLVEILEPVDISIFSTVRPRYIVAVLHW